MWSKKDKASQILVGFKECELKFFQDNALVLHNKKVCLFVCNRGNALLHFSGLRTRELGQSPINKKVITFYQSLVDFQVKSK